MTNQKGLVLKMPFPSRKLSKMYRSTAPAEDIWTGAEKNVTHIAHLEG